jgi:hypothetical protein
MVFGSARSPGWRRLPFTALVVGAPFLLPLLVTYRLRAVNLAPSHFIEGLFRPRPIALRLLVSFLPALLALPVIALLARLAPLDRTARAILIAWIAAAALSLLCHYVCGGPVGPPACTQDLVVTELPSPAGRAALAAGRRMVATTEVFSDPYFPWQPRNLRRLAYLAAAAGKADAVKPVRPSRGGWAECDRLRQIV